MFSSPHEFCQISTVHASVNTITWHQDFSMPPITFNSICASCIFLIQKFFAVVNSHMSISQFGQFIVGFPTIIVDNAAWVYPFLYKWNKSILFSVLYRNHEYFSFVVFFMTSKYPLAFHMMSPVVLAFPKLAFIYFHLYTITTNFFTGLYNSSEA